MTNTHQRQHRIGGALGLYTAGGLFWAFLPFFVGLQVSSGGLTQAQAGSLGSAYLIGFSIVSVTGLWWIRRFNWRVLSGVASVVIIVALLLLTKTNAYLPSLIVVLAIGISMGGFWTIAYRIFSASGNPERSFAIGIVVSYTALALVSYIVGQHIVPRYGLTGSAYFLGGIVLLLGFSAMAIPSTGSDDSSPVAPISYRPPMGVGVALFGILATAFAFATVWAFAERIGVSAGFGSTQISPVIASNLLASAAGSVTATVLGIRLGRSLPLFAGLALLLASVLALLWAESFWLYAGAVAGLGFSVGLVLPYQMGKLAALDAEGRFVVLIAAAQGIGSVGGPALGGMAADFGGIRLLVIVAGVAVLLAAFAFLMILRDGDPA